MLPIRTSRNAAALLIVVTASVAALAVVPAVRREPPPPTDAPQFDDSHFHLTNYIQQGIDARTFLQIMSNRVRRSTLFGIPLQQQWSFANSENFAPTYYLQSDAPLYYYSFTDAYIATAYRSLSADERARFDPMITGFNPADMYGVDHIRRVLQTFPGVFSGIGEFTIHKEFVSAKISGETASLANPALDRILDFAAEAGLVVLIHNDIDVPFGTQGGEPVYLSQMKALLARHPNATIIWAHTGLGRVVQPVSVSAGAAVRSSNHIGIVEGILTDPALRHVNFDISWDEVAKYAVATPDTISRMAALLDRFPDRFLFGTDTVAPAGAAPYYRVYDLWQPVWRLLTPETDAKVRKANYERIFDEARRRVREWERVNVH